MRQRIGLQRPLAHSRPHPGRDIPNSKHNTARISRRDRRAAVCIPGRDKHAATSQASPWAPGRRTSGVKAILRCTADPPLACQLSSSRLLFPSIGHPRYSPEHIHRPSMLPPGQIAKFTTSPSVVHGLFKAAFYTVVSKLIGSPSTYLTCLLYPLKAEAA